MPFVLRRVPCPALVHVAASASASCPLKFQTSSGSGGGADCTVYALSYLETAKCEDRDSTGGKIRSNQSKCLHPDSTPCREDSDTLGNCRRDDQGCHEDSESERKEPPKMQKAQPRPRCGRPGAAKTPVVERFCSAGGSSSRPLLSSRGLTGWEWEGVSYLEPTPPRSIPLNHWVRCSLGFGGAGERVSGTLWRNIGLTNKAEKRTELRDDCNPQ